MGLLDQLMNEILGNYQQKTDKHSHSKHSNAQQENQQLDEKKGEQLFDSLSRLIAQQGGISGLLEQFKQKGLGRLIRDWISTGANPAISGELVKKVLGQNNIRSVASALDLTEQQVANGIAKLLPIVIDKLTPGGKVPQNESPLETQFACNELKSTFFGVA